MAKLFLDPTEEDVVALLIEEGNDSRHPTTRVIIDTLWTDRMIPSGYTLEALRSLEQRGILRAEGFEVDHEEAVISLTEEVEG